MRRKRSDACGALERITGVEPAYAAWEAAVLPMNYIRVFRCEVYYSTDFSRLQREKWRMTHESPGSFHKIGTVTKKEERG